MSNQYPTLESKETGLYYSIVNHHSVIVTAADHYTPEQVAEWVREVSPDIPWFLKSEVIEDDMQEGEKKYLFSF